VHCIRHALQLVGLGGENGFMSESRNDKSSNSSKGSSIHHRGLILQMLEEEFKVSLFAVS
jgi:hypothetical protein